MPPLLQARHSSGPAWVTEQGYLPPSLSQDPDSPEPRLGRQLIPTAALLPCSCGCFPGDELHPGQVPPEVPAECHLGAPSRTCARSSVSLRGAAETKWRSLWLPQRCVSGFWRRGWFPLRPPSSASPWVFTAASSVSLAQIASFHKDTKSSGLGASLVAQLVKNLPSMQETWVQPSGLGRSPGGGNGNPLQSF